MLNGGVPSDAEADIFDTALILHAEHGVNASTLSGMVTSATMTDLLSAVTSSIGALKGPLHGGANQDVMEMLLEIDETGSEPLEWVRNAVERGQHVPGFGHRIYDVKDPRAEILARHSEHLAQNRGGTKWYDVSVVIEDFMAEQKGIAPNVDFYSASTYYQLGIPIDLFTPIFAMSRVTGWTAHAIEYTADNRLIRPLARHTGPEEQSFEAIENR